MVAAAVEATHVIGVDLGGTKILAGLVDREGRITRETQLPTPASSTGDLIDGLERTVAGLIEPGVGAIGFGIPGTIDQTRGQNLFRRRPTLSLDKAAGNTSSGIGVFTIINGKREEIYAFAGIGRGACRA